MGYSHFSRPAYVPVRYGAIDWIEPLAAYSPSTGFHSVNTSGGSPAAISDSSLASPVALGMFDSVTWIFGWVELNSLTIWLSRVSVLPDHMVCQVMFATPPAADDEPGLAAAVLAGPVLAGAGGPLHAARTSAALAAAIADVTPSARPGRRRGAGPGGRGWPGSHARPPAGIF